MEWDDKKEIIRLYKDNLTLRVDTLCLKIKNLEENLITQIKQTNGRYNALKELVISAEPSPQGKPREVAFTANETEKQPVEIDKIFPEDIKTGNHEHNAIHQKEPDDKNEKDRITTWMSNMQLLSFHTAAICLLLGGTTYLISKSLGLFAQSVQESDQCPEERETFEI